MSRTGFDERAAAEGVCLECYRIRVDQREQAELSRIPAVELPPAPRGLGLDGTLAWRAQQLAELPQ